MACKWSGEDVRNLSTYVEEPGNVKLNSSFAVFLSILSLVRDNLGLTIAHRYESQLDMLDGVRSQYLGQLLQIPTTGHYLSLFGTGTGSRQTERIYFVAERWLIPKKCTFLGWIKNFNIYAPQDVRKEC